MTEFKASKARSSIWATLLVCLAALVVSCAANGPSDGPRLYGERSTESTGNSTGTLNTEKDSTNATEATAAVVQTAESSLSKTSATNETPATASKADPNVAPATSGVAPTQAEEQQSDLDELLLYFAEVDTEDSASAVDDQIWRLFDLAEEYYQMGVIANREASWEEAQYYFEKSLKILANLDIEDDSLVTPEAVKYSSLLDNLIADYRVTLRSLGQLEGDIAPSVLVERFGEVGGRLGNDSLVVFKQEQTAITFDLPVKMNDRVKKSIIYYQTVAPDFIYKTLKRSQRYDALFRETLTKHNMPQDLVYLSMVESGFNPHAYSWARAMGLWQFISSTGRMYGLNRSWWVDERKDPVKATDAACRFLKDLYNKFGDWELAMAAYNGGPGRVSREIKKQKTIDFWRLRLRRQTMDYVPLIYAAAIICKDPEKYGFDLGQVEIEPPIVWDDVTIDRCLDLKVVASEVGCSVQELKDLNPELLRNYTPPNEKKYQLKLPVGTRDKFLAAYPTMPSPKETSWVKHEIKRGETVSTIAARYGVSQYAILEANNLGGRSQIYAGKTLIVPVPLDRGNSGWQPSGNRDYTADKSIYTVQQGDNLWDIARGFGTSVDGLRRVNYIKRGSRIYVGQKLKIPSNATKLKDNNRTNKDRSYATVSKPSSGNVKSSSGTSSYKVKAGDTLWDIARAFGTTTGKLRRLNNLGRSSRIYPGQVLAVSGNSTQDYVVHKVRRGENLSLIARKYSTTIARILASNDLTNPDNIRVGTSLKIYTK